MAHEVFALIFHGIVVNVVVGKYEDCNKVAVDMYGESAFAVEVTRIPVEINDTYHDGIFERDVDGVTVTIEPLPTEADEINTLKGANDLFRLELDAVSLAVLDLVEMGEV